MSVEVKYKEVKEIREMTGTPFISLISRILLAFQ